MENVLAKEVRWTQSVSELGLFSGVQAGVYNTNTHNTGTKSLEKSGTWSQGRAKEVFPDGLSLLNSWRNRGRI